MGCAGAIRSGAQWVGVTSFNEWHEGTQIEPAADGARDTVQSFHYEHYQVPPASCPLPPSGYVRGCVQVCLAPSWLPSWLRIYMFGCQVGCFARRLVFLTCALAGRADRKCTSALRESGWPTSIRLGSVASNN